MKFQGAKILEQGIVFGIISVTESVLSSDQDTAQMQGFGRRAYGRIPIVLMAQDSIGNRSYKGRQDIVKFLANIDQSKIPWADWTIND